MFAYVQPTNSSVQLEKGGTHTEIKDRNKVTHSPSPKELVITSTYIPDVISININTQKDQHKLYLYFAL